MKQMWYVRGESKFSDHRPVYSQFQVQIDSSSGSNECCNNNCNENSVVVRNKTNYMPGLKHAPKVQAEELLPPNITTFS